MALIDTFLLIMVLNNGGGRLSNADCETHTYIMAF